MKSKLFSFLKFIIGWPLSLLSFYFLFKFFTPHIPEILSHVHDLNVEILCFAIIAFLLYFLFRVLLWKQILLSWGHNIPFLPTALYWSLAEINRYIPGNIWSIASRSAVFTQFGISGKKSLIGWGVESFLVLLGSLTISFFGLTLLFFHILHPFALRQFFYEMTNGGILLLLLLWIFQKPLSHLIPTPRKIKNILFTPYVAIQLLFFAIISFFFFGLGTYFTIASLFYLPIGQILEFIGLFSAAFLLGYISLITPMGLGIRELTITAGLLGFLAASVVSFASIFSRIILIVSELLFLLIVLIFSRVTFLTHNKIFFFLKKHFSEILLFIGIAMYSLYFTTASFLRYTNFFTGRFDLGNMDQTVWNTIHGRIFQLTDPNGTNTMSRLGTHADFILIFLAPFYLLWRDPRMLLLLQTLVLASGAIFVYLIAKHTCKNAALSLTLALAYLLNPSVQYTNLYDFHAVTFATTFFLASWYFLQKKKYVWTILFLLLAGLTKEEAWIVVGFFGVYIALFHKKRIIGLLTSIIAFVTCYLLIWKFIPLARGGQHFALGYYADFGSTPTSIIKNIFLSPLRVLGLLFEKGRIVYYGELLLPLGFFSILTPGILIFALPDFAINVLSNNAAFHEIYYQYTSVITPFLFIAAISSIVVVQKRFVSISSKAIIIYLFFCTIFSAYVFGPLPGALHPNLDMFTKQQTDSAIISHFLQTIPIHYSVAATNNIGSHLSHRQKIFTIPVGLEQADVVVFLLNDPFAQPSLHAQKEMALKLSADPNYREVFAENDFIVFEKQKVHIEKP